VAWSGLGQRGEAEGFLLEGLRPLAGGAVAERGGEVGGGCRAGGGVAAVEEGEEFGGGGAELTGFRGVAGEHPGGEVDACGDGGIEGGRGGVAQDGVEFHEGRQGAFLRGVVGGIEVEAACAVEVPGGAGGGDGGEAVLEGVELVEGGEFGGRVVVRCGLAGIDGEAGGGGGMEGEEGGGAGPEAPDRERDRGEKQEAQEACWHGGDDDGGGEGVGNGNFAAGREKVCGDGVLG
jgi:hypothetical protein